MSETLRKYVRGLQVHLPGLQDGRYAVERAIRRILRKPADSDFEAIQKLPQGPGILYLDVGANRGFAIEAMSMLAPETDIVALEPNPVLFRKLASVYGNRPDVRLLNLGAGSERGQFTLYHPFYRGWSFDGLASFDRDEAAGWLPDRLAWYDERHLVLREETCTVERIDDLDLKPALIKIDVQGLELEVLRGAERTLRKCEPILLVESGGGPVTDYLLPIGYRPFVWSGNRFSKPIGPTVNTFFMTPRGLESAGGLAD